MCDLFGMSCNAPDRATKALPIFRKLFSKNDPDGWGIGYYVGGKAKIHKKSETAWENKRFDDAVEEAKSQLLIAHLRLASCETVCDKNCHPFEHEYLGRHWIFAHNGTIDNICKEKSGWPSKIRDMESSEIVTIDSARAFTYLLDGIEDYRNTEGKRILGIYPAIEKATESLVEKYAGTLNYILSDGAIMYVFHHNTSNPIRILRREKDYGGALLVSTGDKPLTEESWEPLPPDRLLLISNGEVLTLGTRRTYNKVRKL